GFTKNQEAMRTRMAEAFGGGSQVIENLTRQNMAMFERAMKMFSPFGLTSAGNSDHEAPRASNGNAAPKAPAQSEEISDLKSEIEAMRKQLAELARERK